MNFSYKNGSKLVHVCVGVSNKITTFQDTTPKFHVCYFCVLFIREVSELKEIIGFYHPNLVCGLYAATLEVR